MVAKEKRSRSTNKTFFHFVVYLKDGSRKYYYTAQQIADEFNVSRSTIYRSLRTDNRLYDFGLVKKSYLHHTIVDELVKNEIQSSGR